MYYMTFILCNHVDASPSTARWLHTALCPALIPLALFNHVLAPPPSAAHQNLALVEEEKSEWQTEKKKKTANDIVFFNQHN